MTMLPLLKIETIVEDTEGKITIKAFDEMCKKRLAEGNKKRFSRGECGLMLSRVEVLMRETTSAYKLKEILTDLMEEVETDGDYLLTSTRCKDLYELFEMASTYSKFKCWFDLDYQQVGFIFYNSL